MQIINYPDGSSYAQVEDKDTQLIFRINNYEDLWHLNQVVDALNNRAIIPKIIIPNLLDAQADRRFNPNESSGLKLVAKFLNNMKAEFKIFHPHNSEVVQALMDNVEIMDNTSFIETVLYDIRKNLSASDGKSIDETLILMSSDAGGFKPLMKLCDKIQWRGETTSASKFRNQGNPLIQVVDRDDYEGKDILIIDDICLYGGTFIGLAKLLKDRNIGKLYLAVSHITVENPNPQLFDLFDKVFTTNSKGLDYVTRDDFEPKNLQIINLF